MRIAMISGSLRSGAANTAALREAQRYLKRAHPETEAYFCSVSDLPPFNEDVEAIGWPPAVKRLRHEVESADVVLISTPEYNGSVSGVLKNAIDWLSRPDKAGPLADKPVATMSASPASFGAVWAQENLRFVLEQCESLIVNDDLVSLPFIFDILDEAGDLLPGPEAIKIHQLVDLIVGQRWICQTPNSRPA
jgi:chromate reductase, NAD(P)H dehydrogenase (quinone)